MRVRRKNRRMMRKVMRKVGLGKRDMRQRMRIHRKYFRKR